MEKIESNLRNWKNNRSKMEGNETCKEKPIKKKINLYKGKNNHEN